MRKTAAAPLFFIYCAFISSVLTANENVSNYRSLTFAQAADLALAASSELRQARASQAIMEGAWRWGLREYFPRFNLVISENDHLQKIGVDSFIKSYGISMDQLIWDGGKISTARKLEQTELNLSLSKIERMASEISETAVSAYRNILSSRAILEIRKSAVLILEEQRRILSEETALGLALPVDLAYMDINLADSMLNINSLELDLVEMERQFTELLGLEFLPELTEKIDINHSISLPESSAAGALAKERNPDLIEARFSITKKQAELKYISNSWIPTLKLVGSFGVSGQNYPLTRYNWSVGLNIDFSSPWFQNRFGIQAGREPPYVTTAMVQNNFNPFPDPAAGIAKNQASLALALEQERYNTVLERLGRMTANAVEKCFIAEKKRILTMEAELLGAERCRIEEIRLNLGQITRVQLMEVFIEQTQREIASVEAAVSLLEAERELERFLDLKPGGLAIFAASVNEIYK